MMVGGVDELADWERSLAQIGRRLAGVRVQEQSVKDHGARMAAAAMAAGLSERRAADALGINRMSLRKWLGKEVS